MTTISDDADLDALVRQLNQTGQQDVPVAADPVHLSMGATSSAQALPARRFTLDEGLAELLRLAVERGASDVHLVTGSPAFLRVDGQLQPQAGVAVTADKMRTWFVNRLTAEQSSLLETAGAVDLSVRLPGSAAGPSRSSSPGGARFRINVHRQRDQLAASLRMLPSLIPQFESLGLPPTLRELVRPLQGIVLVCGPTGAGKSTTQAALIDWINRERRAHILTLEDPIEYEHRNHRSLVQQMEVGIDIPGFSQGLKAALRQDPDVILLGEMRDLDSIGTALAAAETGHLLLSTVHTSDPAQAIHRVVDVFPTEAREQMRQLLASGLEAIVCQRLLPQIGGGRVVAVEILRATAAVRHHIRSGAMHKLYNEMVTGQRHGMVTMEGALADLVSRGVVDRCDALARTNKPEELESLLAGR